MATSSRCFNKWTLLKHGIQNINIFEFILQCVDLNYNEVETKGNGKNMVDTTSNFPKVYKE